MNAQEIALTKKQILEGTAYTEIVQIENLGAVRIRQLAEIEFADVKPLIFSGIPIDNNGIVGQLDMMAIMRNTTSANHLVAAYGLSCNGDAWTVEEVGRLSPPGVVNAIAKEVIRISGVSKDLDPFRPLLDGIGDDGLEPAGVQVGDSDAGLDGATKEVSNVAAPEPNQEG